MRQLVRAGNTRTDSAHNRYNIAPVELIGFSGRRGSRGWILWGSTTRIRTIRRSGRRRTSPRPTGWAARYVITSVEKGKAEDYELVSADRHGRGQTKQFHDESDRDS